jgi:hypothetical protein
MIQTATLWPIDCAVVAMDPWCTLPSIWQVNIFLDLTQGLQIPKSHGGVWCLDHRSVIVCSSFAIVQVLRPKSKCVVRKPLNWAQWECNTWFSRAFNTSCRTCPSVKCLVPKILIHSDLGTTAWLKTLWHIPAISKAEFGCRQIRMHVLTFLLAASLLGARHSTNTAGEFQNKNVIGSTWL